MSRPLNILFLADDNHPANSVADHIRAFARHSRHNWHVINPITNRLCLVLDFSLFDMIAIHYSIAIIWDWFLPPRVARRIHDFPGPKIQFIQDEYRQVNAFSERMVYLGIDTLFTLVRQDNVEQAYRHPGLKSVRKVSTLPGFIPDELLDYRAPPLSARRLDLVYRSRRLPYWYGELGQDKVRIAEGVNARASEYDLKVDISIREEDRIYGAAWPRFLCSSKAVLGTEGGASIWDYDGEVQEAVDAHMRQNPSATFEAVAQKILAPYEGNFMYNTISPRLFETAALRSAMVMHPGWYNSIVEPNIHYIPLAKDFSNFPEIVEKLRDLSYLQTLIDRTYADVVRSGRYTKRAFIEHVDQVVDETWAARDQGRFSGGAEQAYGRQRFVAQRLFLARWINGPLSIFARIHYLFARFSDRIKVILADDNISLSRKVALILRICARVPIYAISMMRNRSNCALLLLIRGALLVKSRMRSFYTRHPNIWPYYRRLRATAQRLILDRRAE